MAGIGVAPLVILLLALVSFSSVAGVKCYICAGPCGDEKGKETDCPDTAGVKFGCSKATSGNAVTRSCGAYPAGMDDKCENNICYCTSDLCNAAPSQRSSTSLLPIGLTLLAFFATGKSKFLLLLVVLIGFASFSSVSAQDFQGQHGGYEDEDSGNYGQFLLTTALKLAGSFWRK